MKTLFDITHKTQFQPCCQNFCRDWHETMNGKLPASNHSPNCPAYKTEIFYRVTVFEPFKSDKAPVCILETEGEVKDFCETPEEYEVTTISMTRDQFEHLDEFEGF